VAQYGPSLYAFSFVSVVLLIINFPYDREFLEWNENGRWMGNFILRSVYLGMFLINWAIYMYFLSRSLISDIGPEGNENKFNQTEANATFFAYDTTTYNDIASNMQLIAVFGTIYTLKLVVMTVTGLASHARLMKKHMGTALSRSKQLTVNKHKADLWNRRHYADFVKAENERRVAALVQAVQEKEGEKKLKIIGELSDLVGGNTVGALALLGDIAKDAIEAVGAPVAEAVGVVAGKENEFEDMAKDVIEDAVVVGAGNSFAPGKILKQITMKLNYSEMSNIINFSLTLVLLICQSLYENNIFRFDNQEVQRTDYWYASVIATAFLAATMLLGIMAQFKQMVTPDNKKVFNAAIDPDLLADGNGARSELMASTLVVGEGDSVTEDPGYCYRTFGFKQQDVDHTGIVQTPHMPSGVIHDLIFSWRSGSLYLSPIGTMGQTALYANDFYFIVLMYLVSEQQMMYLILTLGIAFMFSSEQFDGRSFDHIFTIASAVFFQGMWCWYSFQITTIDGNVPKYMFGNQNSIEGFRFFQTDFYDPMLGANYPSGETPSRLGLLTSMSTLLLVLGIYRCVMSISYMLFAAYTYFMYMEEKQ
jgi:hypothetical protein